MNERNLKVSKEIVEKELQSVKRILHDWTKKVTNKAKKYKVDIDAYCAQISFCAAKLEALVAAELEALPPQKIKASIIKKSHN